MSMKNFLRLSSVLVTFLSPVMIAGTANATVVWTATFEKNKSGDVCSSGAPGAEFSPGINETKGTRINAEVVALAAHSGSLGCNVTVHPDDTFTFGQNRVDIQHKSTLTAEGMDSYLSGYYMMPADAQVRNEIGFYETLTTSSNAMDIWVAPKTGGGTTINFAIGFLPMTASWTADFKIGVWHQIGIHVHWSQMATVGYADIWLDGVKTVTMLKGKTKPDGNPLFYQTGLHRRNTYQVTDTIYFDDFSEGDAEADMNIAVPGSSGGPDGGAGGATGTGGSTGAGGSTGTAGAGGSTGAAGSGATGAAGSSATGAAGSASTGGAGSGATGAAGSGATGAAGSASTGGAGSGVTGAAGSNATGAAGSGAPHASKSGGCTVAGDSGRGAFGLAALALLGTLAARRRRSRGGSR
jgi:MYXO-CTERM domain-containing protein